MRCFVMFVTAVCVLFLLKLKWPKNKSFYLFPVLLVKLRSPWVDLERNMKHLLTTVPTIYIGLLPRFNRNMWNMKILARTIEIQKYGDSHAFFKDN